MADVTCPLTFEDRQALLSHQALPPALRTILEDRARAIELVHGYDLEWPEAEARSVLAHAESHDLAVAQRAPLPEPLRRVFAELYRPTRDAHSGRSWPVSMCGSASKTRTVEVPSATFLLCKAYLLRARA